jgi:23S rRNA (adenine1618-N6)-methyltransferase
MHPRNRHQGRYDFDELIKNSPELAPFVAPNPYGDLSVVFSDPAAVRALNRALLKTFHGITAWDIPDGYLCPPIPGRADYLHYLADVLAQDNNGQIPRGPNVSALDIGVGANLIYPLIGHAEYGWQFLGSDIDPAALASARRIIESNPGLAQAMEVRRQASPNRMFHGVIGPDERFDVTLCNPPFHGSADEAQNSTQRKWRGLGKAGPQRREPVRNFGGRNTELWYEGGEALFVRRLIEESADVSHQALWFSTLVSKESNLPEIRRNLKNVGTVDARIIDMTQGQKTSRMVAWTFQNRRARQEWRARRWED